MATCEARGINPFEYLADVLTRARDHPRAAIDELLAGPWAASREFPYEFSAEDGVDLQKDMPERAMDISTRDYMSFGPVYTFTDETLHEISNSTEHALMHYAWSPSGEGKWQVRLAVYVKHRTAFSAFYMNCIRPFRQFVVYPHIFRKCMEIWEARKVSK